MTHDRTHDLPMLGYAAIAAMLVSHDVLGLVTTVIVAVSVAVLLLVLSVGTALLRHMPRHRRFSQAPAQTGGARAAMMD